MAYQWQANLACIATYKTLEADDGLDQFEEADIPFAKAEKVEMKRLRFFPSGTSNTDIIQVLAIEMARRFVKLLVKRFSVKKQKKEVSSQQIIMKIAAVLAQPKATLTDLAEVVDDEIQFADE
jgi:hypothetical protein